MGILWVSTKLGSLWTIKPTKCPSYHATRCFAEDITPWWRIAYGLVRSLREPPLTCFFIHAMRCPLRWTFITCRFSWSLSTYGHRSITQISPPNYVYVIQQPKPRTGLPMLSMCSICMFHVHPRSAKKKCSLNRDSKAIVIYWNSMRPLHKATSSCIRQSYDLRASGLRFFIRGGLGHPTQRSNIGTRVRRDLRA